jgi:hypothetical protein
MKVNGARSTLELPLILGIASAGSALAGLAAWAGYARDAGDSIRAVISRVPTEAHRLAELAGWWSLAQLLLGLLAVGLALYVRSRGGISGGARWVSGAGLVLGAAALLLTLLLV